jgi:integrase
VFDPWGESSSTGRSCHPFASSAGHDRRHACATSLLAAGLGSHAVAALLGHADASLVDRRYGHALPDELATAADRLSEWRQARAAKA